MKYLKLATIAMLLLAVLGMTAFGANSPAGRLKMPARDISSVSNEVLKSSSHNSHRAIDMKEMSSPVGRNLMASSKPRHIVTRTKTHVTIPPEILSGGLSGTFHIGAANQFKTIADMAFLLNIANIAGPVTMLLDDPTYTEAAATIGASPGASAVNNITIRPNTGNTSCVITLTSDGNGGLVLNGANYISINGTAVGASAGSRNLKIQLAGFQSVEDAPVMVLGGSNSVSIANCVIPGNSTSQVFADVSGGGNGSVTAFASAGNYNTHLTVDNCELSGGHFGVYTVGNFPATAGDYGIQDDHITVSNNWVHDVTEDGIDLQMVTAASVKGNNVSRVVLGVSAGAAPFLGGNLPLLYRPAGIQVWGDVAEIDNNIVDSVVNNRTSTGTFGAGTYGIRAFGFGNNDPGLSFLLVPSTNRMVNNVVTRIYSKAAQTNLFGAHVFGLEFASGRQDTMYHNTVYLSGAELGTTGRGACAVMVAGVYFTAGGFPIYTGDALVTGSNAAGRQYAKNNIFAINRTGLGSGPTHLIEIGGASSIDWRAGSDNNVTFTTTGVVGATSAGVVYPSLFDFTGFNGTDTHSQADDPTLVSESDVHINPAGLSTADGNGLALGGRVPKDIAGTTRTSPPDIGAYEGTGAGQPHDVKPLALLSPGASGAPAGLPFSPIQISILNLASQAEVSVPVNVHIIAPNLSTVDFPGTVNVNASASASVTLAGTWTPAAGGDYTFQITTALGTDNYTSNDLLTVHIPVAAQQTLPYTSGFENSTEQSGWFATGDWAIGSNTGGNSKLGGSHIGDKCYVTKPGASPLPYTDATQGYVFSPYFDFTGADSTNSTLSFYQSIKTEPHWDRSWMDYSLDTGKTWHQLGSLNDANGINWYSTAVYANAFIGNAGTSGPQGCWDSAYARSHGYEYVNLPVPSWTSNGDCAGADAHTGPNGYVLVVYDLSKLAPGVSPLGHQFVRFRYASWADGGAGDDGWAIDDFHIGAPPVLAQHSYSGKVFIDANANHVNDAETGIGATKIYITYFGTVIDSQTTAGDGSFSFVNKMTLPGVYSVVTNLTNTSYALSVTPSTNYVGAADVTGQDLGYYLGSISGNVYNDVNDNGAFDVGEGGLGGWTVEVHADSITGALVNSTVSGAGGAYTVYVLPGSYYSKLTAQVGVRASGTVVLHDVISGTSGSGTAVKTGDQFFEYTLGKWTVFFQQDPPGSGVTPGAVVGMPVGVKGFFQFFHADTLVRTDTLGDFNNYGASYQITGLDSGTYKVKMLNHNFSAAWLNTSAADSVTVNFQTSGIVNATHYLGFQLAHFNGRVYNDLNGDTVQSVGDLGLLGWTATLSGTHPDTVVSDSNGNFSFTGVYPGAHTVTVAIPSGWTINPGNTFGFTPTTGQGFTDNTFGAFQFFTASGNVYRDRDNNGAKNGSDSPLSGVVVSITRNGGAPTTTNSDGSGNYSFSGLATGSYSVSAASPVGFSQTQPPILTPNHSFVGNSNTNRTGNDFGEFQVSDDAKYRTLTAADFAAAFGQKLASNKKLDTLGKVSNLINDVVASIVVGVPGSTYPGGAARAYLQPKKFTDVLSTFKDKAGATHLGGPNGFDFDVKHKLMTKKIASMPPGKYNNQAIASLLALRLNLSLSNAGNTPAGLGNLVIANGGAFNGMSLNAFMDSASSLMSKWDHVPQTTYDAMNSMASAINSAFSGPVTITDFHTSGHGHLAGTVTSYSTGFLAPGTVASPSQIVVPPVTDENEFIPKTYALFQNYPNPFNPTTTLRFDLPFSSIVTVKIYNVLGQEVATLFDHESMDQGRVEESFNATQLSSGVYFYRVIAEAQNDDGVKTGQTFTQVKKMSLIK